MPETVYETREMLAEMNPLLGEDEFVFCATSDPALAARAQSSALGWFKEEGEMSLILERRAARALGFSADLPMRRIALMVNSALDGVGLTAAVSSTLAAAGIPCNMVAACRHDHVFVPSAVAERALAILAALQAGAS